MCAAGCMESYVRNVPGGTPAFESLKSEAFMDLSLSIREFGNPTPIASIEEGLTNSVKPEKLEGNNQYKLDPDMAQGRAEPIMVVSLFT